MWLIWYIVGYYHGNIIIQLAILVGNMNGWNHNFNEQLHKNNVYKQKVLVICMFKWSFNYFRKSYRNEISTITLPLSFVVVGTLEMPANYCMTIIKFLYPLGGTRVLGENPQLSTEHWYYFLHVKIERSFNLQSKPSFWPLSTRIWMTYCRNEWQVIKPLSLISSKPPFVAMVYIISWHSQIQCLEK